MHIAPKSPTEITRAHRMFEVALLLKGLNGIVELVGGTLALFVPLRTVNQLVLWLTASEIENDPNDWLANTLINAAEKLSMGTKEYASFYLLAHGAVLAHVGPTEGAIRYALAHAPDRRRLYDEGKYVPTSHAVIWTRDAMLKWAGLR